MIFLAYKKNQLNYFKKKNLKSYYIGFDYDFKNQLFNKGVKLSETKDLLSKSAKRIKFDFINYISSIETLQNNKQSWWSSSIASKSNLQTNFFSDLSAIIAVKQLNDDLEKIIYVNDFKLYNLIKTNFNCKTKLSFQYYYDLILFFSVCVFKNIINRIRFFFLRVFYWIVSINYFKQYDESVYLYSWVEDRSFNNNSYNDPYFPDCIKYHKKNQVVIFCPYKVDTYLLKKFGNEVKLDGMANYDKFKYFLKSITKTFKPKYFKKFKNTDINFLWICELFFENSKIEYISNFHDYFVWKNFFLKNSGKIIYPFENQPWEKVMLLSKNNFNRNFSTIGVIHTTLHNLLLPFHTTEKELKNIPLPDYIISNSKNTHNIYCKYYKNSKTKIINAGSLRFNSLNQTKKSRINHQKHIGVMLSCIKSQALEQMDDIYKSHSNNKLYHIKVHPDCPINIYEEQNIKVWRGTANEMYYKIDCIVYCSSTSGLEAYQFGIPVFRFNTQFLDLETGEHEFQPTLIDSVSQINDKELSFNSPNYKFTKPVENLWLKIFKNGKTSI